MLSNDTRKELKFMKYEDKVGVLLSVGLSFVITVIIVFCNTMFLTSNKKPDTNTMILASDTLSEKPKIRSKNYVAECYHDCITSHEFSFLNPANCQRSNIFTIHYRGHTYIVLSDTKRPSAICHDLECPCLQNEK